MSDNEEIPEGPGLYAQITEQRQGGELTLDALKDLLANLPQGPSTRTYTLPGAMLLQMDTDHFINELKSKNDSVTYLCGQNIYQQIVDRAKSLGYEINGNKIVKQELWDKTAAPIIIGAGASGPEIARMIAANSAGPAGGSPDMIIDRQLFDIKSESFKITAPPQMYMPESVSKHYHGKPRPQMQSPKKKKRKKARNGPNKKR